MAKSMREALDEINKKEKENQRERERPDREEFERKTSSQEAVKGKSVTSVKSAKDRYDEYMKKNSPKISKTLRTVGAGLLAGPVGFGIAALKTVGEYIKASNASKDEAIQDLIDSGVGESEARSVVDAAIRGNPDIARSSDTSSGSGGATERRERAMRQGLDIDEVVNVMQGGEPSGKYSPVYQEGSGYGNLYNPQGAQQQAGMQGNQIVAASQQPLTEFGGYGGMANNVVPTNAQQFTQTPTSNQQNKPEFWDIAEKLVMEGS